MEARWRHKRGALGGQPCVNIVIYRTTQPATRWRSKTTHFAQHPLVVLFRTFYFFVYLYIHERHNLIHTLLCFHALNCPTTFLRVDLVLKLTPQCTEMRIDLEPGMVLNRESILIRNCDPQESKSNRENHKYPHPYY